MRTRRLPPLAALLLATASADAAPRRGAPSSDLVGLEARLARLEAQMANRPRDVGAFRLPDALEFCGETIDLTDPDVRERVEHEYYLVLGDRAQVVLWTKRARRVFPVIEAQAREAGLCADLKYVAVIESGLRSAVTSRASAKGWWQFMAGTGRQYGLDISQAWDQRADLSEATRAGLTYLESLHQQFGSWPLALAAYNTGPGRLKRAQETQGVSRFWDLDLYTEAERYFPRTLAIKAVMSDLPGHDFALDVEDGWAPRPHGYVKLDVPEGVEIPVLAAAKGAGIPPRTLRAYNPEMGKADHLPHGREVVVEVPQGKERALRDWVAAEVERARALAKSPAKPKARGKKTAKRGRGAEAAASSKAVAKASKRAKRAEKRSKRSAKRAKRSRPRTYTIRAGDSLWSIAQRKNVSVADLRKWNKLGRTDVIAPGQELLVEARR